MPVRLHVIHRATHPTSLGWYHTKRKVFSITKYYHSPLNLLYLGVNSQVVRNPSVPCPYAGLLVSLLRVHGTMPSILNRIRISECWKGNEHFACAQNETSTHRGCEKRTPQCVLFLGLLMCNWCCKRESSENVLLKLGNILLCLIARYGHKKDQFYVSLI